MFDDLKMLVNGEWRSGSHDDALSLIDPATNTQLGLVPSATSEDLRDALEGANAAAVSWRATSALVRSDILRKAASMLRSKVADLAVCLTREQGKPLAESQTELLHAADIIDWYAEEGKRLYGRIVPARTRNVRQTVYREPIGPVAAFTPWNFPAVTPARKIAGALAAGCTCIIKPSEETPATAIHIARALVEAGLPKGVLNVVFGRPEKISSELLSSPIIKKLSFTGSIPVGKHLAALAANTIKACTLELGGHAPVLIFADADPIAAADSIAKGRFRNAGQICISPSRFYVHESIYDRFVARFIEITSRLRVGNGLESNCEIGPLANERRLIAMEKLIADCESVGGKVRTGGTKIGKQGFFFKPAVVTDVPDTCAIMQDEIFGPITPIVPFSTTDEAISRANSLPYGLAAYAYTQSLDISMRLSDEIEAGMVGINHPHIFPPETPFGGMKESGYGSEGGIEGLMAYTTTKFVSESGVI
jgi:succinate-semialdehyde dehydrogenase / glutarate-semialdehyde dehydrogenase